MFKINFKLLISAVFLLFIAGLVFVSPVQTAPEEGIPRLEVPRIDEILPDREVVHEEEKTPEEKLRKLRTEFVQMRERYEARFYELHTKIEELEQDNLTMEDTIAEQKQVIADFEDTVADLRSDSQQMRGVIAELRGETTPREVASVSRPEAQPEKKKEPVDVDVDIPFARPLNPNTASVEDLKRISELSEQRAQRIEWYRNVVSNFNSREDLRRVPGIGEDLYEQIKHYFQPGNYN